MHEDFNGFNVSMPDSLAIDPCLRSASGQRRREKLLLLVWVNDAVRNSAYLTWLILVPGSHDFRETATCGVLDITWAR